MKRMPKFLNRSVGRLGRLTYLANSRESVLLFVDTLVRHALNSVQMVCGALRRTVLRLHQTLRRGGWVAEHVSTDLALDSTPCSVEICQGNDPKGSENKSKPMNDTTRTINHPKPPRLVRILINSLVTTILRSPWHGIRSQQLLLLTFTGRKSGKEFTTPMRYVQEGERLRMIVVYPWWRNLLGEATVHVLLQGQMRTGIAEVLPEEDGEVVVNVHLNG